MLGGREGLVGDGDGLCVCVCVCVCVSSMSFQFSMCALWELTTYFLLSLLSVDQCQVKFSSGSDQISQGRPSSINQGKSLVKGSLLCFTTCALFSHLLMSKWMVTFLKGYFSFLDPGPYFFTHCLFQCNVNVPILQPQIVKSGAGLSGGEVQINPIDSRSWLMLIYVVIK